MKSAALRTRVEAALGPSFPSPFAFREPQAPEVISCGLEEMDALIGGLPRGGLTEIFGPASSGRTSLVLSILAAITTRAEVGALVDAQDTFDPHSAAAAGIELGRLLWVRCRHIEQALKAADLLLQGGGFGVVALDLGDLAPEIARRVPLSSWFRFRRAVEHTPTVLVLLEQEPCAKSCASLVLRLGLETGNWQRETRNGKRETNVVPHANLLHGVRLKVEVVRNRNWKLETGNGKLEIRSLKPSPSF